MGSLPGFIRGILLLCVMAALSLEDTFSACGVDPTIATALVAAGWTAETYACAAPHEEALDEIWGELVPDDDLSLFVAKVSSAGCFQALSQCGRTSVFIWPISRRSSRCNGWRDQQFVV